MDQQRAQVLLQEPQRQVPAQHSTNTTHCNNDQPGDACLPCSPLPSRLPKASPTRARLGAHVRSDFLQSDSGHVDGAPGQPIVVVDTVEILATSTKSEPVVPICAVFLTRGGGGVFRPRTGAPDVGAIYTPRAHVLPDSLVCVACFCPAHSFLRPARSSEQSLAFRQFLLARAQTGQPKTPPGLVRRQLFAPCNRCMRIRHTPSRCITSPSHCTCTSLKLDLKCSPLPKAEDALFTGQAFNTINSLYITSALEQDIRVARASCELSAVRSPLRQ